MTKTVVLRGYKFSVYTRIARMALHEKGVAYETQDINPFADDVPKEYLKRNPFGRVPVLSHGVFDVYETPAILRYVEAAFDGPSLVPVGAEPLARVAQVSAIVDNYGYRPMVRQVFAHRVFRPAIGEPSDETQIAAGITASLPVLGALNTLAREGHVLNDRDFTLADCHLAPMIAYFVQAPEGADALTKYPALADWWAKALHRRCIKTTDPGVPLGWE